MNSILDVNRNQSNYKNYKRVRRQTKSTNKAKAKSEEICDSNECETYGKLYKQLIDTSVDPCHDFYDYVCGKFTKSTVIPENMVSFGALERADEKVTQIVKRELSESHKRCDSKSIKYATNLYNGCTDFAKLESRGIKPLINALNSIGGWPLIPNTVFNGKTYDRFHALSLVIANFALSSIIEIGVQPDIRDNTKNILYLGSAPDLSLEWKKRWNRRNRTRLMVPIIPTIADDNMNSMDEIKMIREFVLTQCLIMGAKDSVRTLQQIDELFMFSSRLESIQTEETNLDMVYNKMTFKQLNALSSNKMDWVSLINNIYRMSGTNARFTKEDQLIVTDIQYFTKLPQILLKTPNRVIANFLGFSVVQMLSDYTIKKFRQMDFELQKSLTGITTPPEDWKLCVELVDGLMPFATSRKYIENNFDLRAKRKSTELVNYIQKAFYKSLQTNPVLEKSTRTMTLAKVKQMTKNIGYPDWLFDDRTLDSMYNLDMECNKDKTFECILHLLKRSVYTNFKSIDEPVNATLNWPFAPTTVNAAYFPTFNSIRHEITHGFDSSGSQFNEKGNLGTIWDKPTQRRFNQKENCFINQYNNYCDSGFCVSGENTKTENTADNGGLRNTFKAYKMCNHNGEKPKRLPH
ncbi:unnamed protein product, partial [Medioppia subpectinata]